MERTNPSPLRVALIAALCAIASPSSAARLSASNTGSAANTSNGNTTSSAQPGQTNANDDEVCTCEATYSDGTTDDVAECLRSECPDLDRYNACRDVATTHQMPIGGCRLLESCECNCRSTQQATTEYYDEDVFLAGVPNLWQFDYRCGTLGMNAVGCGPVAASMVMYWWAEQGYGGIVDGLMSGPGGSPADREHDWQAMVRTFRDRYLNGGICVVNNEYATLQGTMRDGIDGFLADAGYASASVGHYKVCDDCNRNESEEISASSGLDLIQDELYAGRPVIMGFNVGRAVDETTLLDEDDGSTLEVFSGPLSNGTPLAGIIGHYAVITGYRRVDGEDVVLVNMGWEGDKDIPFLWRLAGPWLHLYTVDLNGAPDNDDFCAIDRGIDATFLDSGDLDLSFDEGIAPRTVLAGTSCGIVREVTEHSYYPTWSGAHFECDPYAGLPEFDEEPGTLGTVSTDPRGSELPNNGGLILDQELPLP